MTTSIDTLSVSLLLGLALLLGVVLLLVLLLLWSPTESDGLDDNRQSSAVGRQSRITSHEL